eukprot:CAMPEP_0194596172 /NCGR_PEP_ID=MMETSP0292-20121207/25483_1 /TAXON_ID=39354 /ORGANISM="Heterosigma akashiwo, Strain CCMP2393" /LENGTH=164 /DNA_ID=CAMNT_0039456347 /DNA_START=179 /DNA_END=674 /DNA_ORIENTATION=-
MTTTTITSLRLIAAHHPEAALLLYHHLNTRRWWGDGSTSVSSSSWAGSPPPQPCDPAAAAAPPLSPAPPLPRRCAPPPPPLNVVRGEVGLGPGVRRQVLQEGGAVVQAAAPQDHPLGLRRLGQLGVQLRHLARLLVGRPSKHEDNHIGGFRVERSSCGRELTFF